MTQYRSLLDRISEETEADAVALVILRGNRGSGVAIKVDAETTPAAFALVPELVEALRAAANQLTADAQEHHRTNGN